MAANYLAPHYDFVFVKSSELVSTSQDIEPHKRNEREMLPDKQVAGEIELSLIRVSSASSTHSPLSNSHPPSSSIHFSYRFRVPPSTDSHCMHETTMYGDPMPKP